MSYYPRPDDHEPDQTSCYGGYTSPLYQKVEDFAEAAFTTRGHKRDAALRNYLTALYTLCHHRTSHDACVRAVMGEVAA